MKTEMKMNTEIEPEMNLRPKQPCHTCGNFDDVGNMVVDPNGSYICDFCSNLRYQIACERCNRWVLDSRIWKWRADADHEADVLESDDENGYKYIVLELQ